MKSHQTETFPDKLRYLFERIDNRRRSANADRQDRTTKSNATSQPMKVDVVGENEDAELRRKDLEALAHWMDTAFRVPGLGIRFGLDSLIGLIPGFGDTATSAVSLYILNRAAQEGVPRTTMIRMAANIAVDYMVGAIPLLGDVFDVFFKVNRRNVDILRQHVEANRARQQEPASVIGRFGAGELPQQVPPVHRASRGDRIFVGVLIAGLILLLIGSVTVAYLLVYAAGTLLFT